MTLRENLMAKGDDIVIRAVKKELDQDGYDHFDLVSITSLDLPNITSVIVNTGFSELALEIDSHNGKVIHKERIAS